MTDKNAETQPDAAGYVPATAVSNVIDGEITAVTLDGTKIILVRWQEQIHALSSKCPHAAADMAEGDVYRGKIACPDHGYVFDVQNGRILWPEDEMLCLKRYPVKMYDETVFVKLP